MPGDEKLYIGSVLDLYRPAALRAAGVTHVLSVLPLNLKEDQSRAYEHLVVDLDDLEHANLLQCLPTTNAFIQRALSGDGAVLVHW
ncbi:MAG: tyrosine protein phosphatase yvh1 [Phylliscum demangeonii]|nr:MAG: tyrosine protein phosphatase yvh1 [Phylliscum demangeonii]